MVVIYIQTDSGIQSVIMTDDNEHLLEQAIWLDLQSPTRDEERIIEDHIHLDIPTKEEMEEIEPSSRLYTEDDALFMTATMVAKSDLPQPKTDVVSFILTSKLLITVRYIELQSFKLFIPKLLRLKTKNFTSINVLVSLLESATDRLADILERVSHKFDDISQTIFHTADNDDMLSPINYKEILQALGLNGDLGTKARESLVSFIRLVSFLDQSWSSRFDQDIRSRITIINKDIVSLSDYAGFISTKVNFLLDATLGMLNIEQNNIIKIFSVAAVIFLPPTLIASVYGMNFQFMPELNWHFGYPLAILMMVVSAVLPFTYFKKKKWL